MYSRGFGTLSTFGGSRARSASFLGFCTIAARWNSSRAQERPSEPQPFTVRFLDALDVLNERFRRQLLSAISRTSEHFHVFSPPLCGSRLKLIDASGRSRLICQPSSRRENPPYGMMGEDRGNVRHHSKPGPRLDPTRPKLGDQRTATRSRRSQAQGRLDRAVGPWIWLGRRCRREFFQVSTPHPSSDAHRR
jgi:hypothetical protein